MLTLAEGEIKKYAIAGRNVLAGIVDFLALAVPREWQVRQGVTPLEVDRYRQRAGRVWATNGRADYTLISPAGTRIDLTIELRGGRARPPAAGRGMAERVPLRSGHDAAVEVAHDVRGLFRKQAVQVLRLSLYCEQTDRSLRFEAAGAAAPGEIETLLGALAWCECH